MTVIDVLFFTTLDLCSNALALESGKSQAIFCTDAYLNLSEGLDLVQRTQVKDRGVRAANIPVHDSCWSTEACMWHPK